MKYWNTVYLFASGGLIVYILSLFIKKKNQAIPRPSTGYRPTPLTPSKNVLSFDEIFQWINKEERGNLGPSLTAKPDGKDKKGNQLYSIGYGHQIQPNEQELFYTTITPEKALELFKKDVDSIIKNMNSLIKVPLNKNQQLALFSLRYNIGPDAFEKSSVLRLLNEGNYNGSALKFGEWRLSEGKINQGLVNRRERERILFSKPL